MNRLDQINIFKAQTENVRDINKTWKHVQRSINHELVCDNLTSASVHTKLLALVFCAWSEANFSKLIHTPHGFELDEIQQIKNLAKGNIVDGWLKCLELGLHQVLKTPKSNYIPNIKQSVERLIKKYIQEPRVLRNKIAHGQWKIALNRENDKTNNDLTDQINNIDVVQLNVWKEAHQGLSNIIEVLIESPDRAFHRDYWLEIVKVNEHLNKTKTWKLEDKIQFLKTKQSLHKTYNKANSADAKSRAAD
jgi:transcriptional regulator of heat shock response